MQNAPRKHSAILSTFIKLPFDIMIIVLSIFEWPLKTDFTVLSYRCIVPINVLWLFHMVPWAGLQCVIVVFPDHTHFLVNVQDALF